MLDNIKHSIVLLQIAKVKHDGYNYFKLRNNKKKSFLIDIISTTSSSLLEHSSSDKRHLQRSNENWAWYDGNTR